MRALEQKVKEKQEEILVAKKAPFLAMLMNNTNKLKRKRMHKDSKNVYHASDSESNYSDDLQ
jgi:hypothetical protein